MSGIAILDRAGGGLQWFGLGRVTPGELMRVTKFRFNPAKKIKCKKKSINNHLWQSILLKSIRITARVHCHPLV
jgi:hypothetical protein